VRYKTFLSSHGGALAIVAVAAFILVGVAVLDGHPPHLRSALRVAPGTITFGLAASTRSVVLSNSQRATIRWSVDPLPGISVEPTAGTLAPRGRATVTLTIHRYGLGALQTPAELRFHDSFSRPTSAVAVSWETPGPTLSRLSRADGPTGGGTRITIAGTGFGAGATVDFGPDHPAASATVVSPFLIRATSPAGAGTVQVTVTSGGKTSAGSAAGRFTYRGVGPGVTGVSRSAGPASGGTQVTITGAGFRRGALVDFGLTPARDVRILSATAISALSPAGTGTVDITVTDAGNTSPASLADRFVYQPVIRSVRFSGSPRDPLVTVAGAGLGAEPARSPSGCGGGDDFANDAVVVEDSSNQWFAGKPGDCVGLVITRFSQSEITFTFGSSYGQRFVNAIGQRPPTILNPGDRFVIEIGGTSLGGAVSYRSSQTA